MAPTSPRRGRRRDSSRSRSPDGTRHRDRRAYRSRSRSPRSYDSYKSTFDHSDRYREREVHRRKTTSTRRDSERDERAKLATIYNQNIGQGIKDNILSPMRDGNTASEISSPVSSSPRSENRRDISRHFWPRGQKLVSKVNQPAMIHEGVLHLAMSVGDDLEVIRHDSKTTYQCENLTSKEIGRVYYWLVKINRSQPQQRASEISQSHPTQGWPINTILRATGSQFNHGPAIQVSNGDQIKVLRFVSGSTYHCENLKTQEVGQVNGKLLAELEKADSAKVPLENDSTSIAPPQRHENNQAAFMPTGPTLTIHPNGTVVKAIQSQVGYAPYLGVKVGQQLEVLSFNPDVHEYLCRNLETNHSARVQKNVISAPPQPSSTKTSNSGFDTEHSPTSAEIERQFEWEIRRDSSLILDPTVSSTAPENRQSGSAVSKQSKQLSEVRNAADVFTGNPGRSEPLIASESILVSSNSLTSKASAKPIELSTTTASTLGASKLGAPTPDGVSKQVSTFARAGKDLGTDSSEPNLTTNPETRKPGNISVESSSTSRLTAPSVTEGSKLSKSFSSTPATKRIEVGVTSTSDSRFGKQSDTTTDESGKPLTSTRPTSRSEVDFGVSSVKVVNKLSEPSASTISTKRSEPLSKSSLPDTGKVKFDGLKANTRTVDSRNSREVQNTSYLSGSAMEITSVEPRLQTPTTATISTAAEQHSTTQPRNSFSTTQLLSATPEANSKIIHEIIATLTQGALENGATVTTSHDVNPGAIAAMNKAIKKLFQKNNKIALRMTEKEAANTVFVKAEAMLEKDKETYRNFPAFGESAARKKEHAKQELKVASEKLRHEEEQLDTFTMELANTLIPALISSGAIAAPAPTPQVEAERIEAVENKCNRLMDMMEKQQKLFQKEREEQQELIVDQKKRIGKLEEAIKDQGTRIIRQEVTYSTLGINGIRTDLSELKRDVASSTTKLKHIPVNLDEQLKKIPTLETDLGKVKITCDDFPGLISSVRSVSGKINERVTNIERAEPARKQVLEEITSRVNDVEKNCEGVKKDVSELQERPVLGATTAADLKGALGRISVLETKAPLPALPDAAAIQALETRLKAVEAKPREMPLPARPDTAVTQALETRIKTIETQVPGLSRALNTLQTTVETNTVALNEFKTKVAKPPALATIPAQVLSPDPTPAIQKLQQDVLAVGKSIQANHNKYAEIGQKQHDFGQEIEAIANTTANLASRVDNISTHDVAQAAFDQLSEHIYQKVPALRDLAIIQSTQNAYNGLNTRFSQMENHYNKSIPIHTENARRLVELQDNQKIASEKIATLERSQSSVSESRRNLGVEVDKIALDQERQSKEYADLKQKQDNISSELDGFGTRITSVQTGLQRMKDSAGDDALSKKVDTLEKDLKVVQQDVLEVSDVTTQVQQTAAQLRTDLDSNNDAAKTQLNELKTQQDQDSETVAHLRQWKSAHGMTKSEFENYKAQVETNGQAVTSTITTLEKKVDLQTAFTTQRFDSVKKDREDQIAKDFERFEKLEKSIPSLGFYNNINDNFAKLFTRFEKLERKASSEPKRPAEINIRDPASASKSPALSTPRERNNPLAAARGHSDPQRQPKDSGRDSSNKNKRNGDHLKPNGGGQQKKSKKMAAGATEKSHNPPARGMGMEMGGDEETNNHSIKYEAGAGAGAFASTSKVITKHSSKVIVLDSDDDDDDDDE